MKAIQHGIRTTANNKAPGARALVVSSLFAHPRQALDFSPPAIFTSRAVKPGMRGFSTASPADGPPVSPDVMERLRSLAETVTKDVQMGVDAMKREFGDRHAAGVWMTEYYRHKQHKYLVPAALLMCTDPQMMSLPSLAVKNAVFLGSVLRSLPAEVATNYSNAMPLVKGMDVPFLLSVLHAAGTPAAKSRFDMMGVSVRRANARGLIEAGQHIAAVPTPTPHAWPAPHAEPSLVGAGTPWPPANRHALFPWELNPVFSGLRETLSRRDWLQLAGTTHLEALWAAFYASGDPKFVSRIVDIAAGWGEFSSSLPDGAVPYIVNLESPLPEALVGTGTDSDSHEVAMRGVRAQVSRIAVWTLLHHTRRHPGEHRMQAGTEKERAGRGSPRMLA